MYDNPLYNDFVYNEKDPINCGLEVEQQQPNVNKLESPLWLASFLAKEAGMDTEQWKEQQMPLS